MRLPTSSRSSIRNRSYLRNLPGLLYWLDASSITLGNGGAVSASDWIDLSANNRGALQTASSLTFVRDFCGFPAVQLTGASNSRIVTASFTATQPVYVYLVCYLTSGSRVFDSGSDTNGLVVAFTGSAASKANFVSSSGTTLFSNFGMYNGSSFVMTNDGIQLEQINVYSATFNGASSSHAWNASADVSGTATTATTTSGFTIGAPGGGFNGLYSGGYVYEFIVMSSAASASDREFVRSYLLDKYNARRRHLCVTFDGNSLTSGTGATSSAKSYPRQFADLGNPYAMIYNNGIADQTTSQMDTRAATTSDVSRGVFLGCSNVLVAWELTNDIYNGGSGGVSGATAYGNFETYCSNRRAAGWTLGAGCPIVVLSCLKSTRNTAGMETARQDANTLLAANWSSFADAYVDVAALSELSDPSNTTYFSDGIHLKDAGYQVVARAVRDAIVRII